MTVCIIENCSNEISERSALLVCPLCRCTLSNTEMAKIMAHENMSEWMHDVHTDVETMRAVLKAYGSGEIDLPKCKASGQGRKRVIPGSSPEKTFTAESLREFLGWKIGKAALLTLLALSALQGDGP
jgi:hypothetical protein